MFRNFVGREQQRSSRNGVNGLKFATTKIPRRWITDLFNGQIPREFGCPADKSFVFDPREKLHPPLREVSSVSLPFPPLPSPPLFIYRCARRRVCVRVSRILERRFTPRFGVPRGASFFVLDPYFCAEISGLLHRESREKTERYASSRRLSDLAYACYLGNRRTCLKLP